MNFKIASALALFLNKVSTAGVDFTYATNGADWPAAFPDCALPNQSPIDLSSAPNAYPRYSAADDQFTKIY